MGYALSLARVGPLTEMNAGVGDGLPSRIPDFVAAR